MQITQQPTLGNTPSCYYSNYFDILYNEDPADDESVVVLNKSEDKYSDDATVTTDEYTDDEELSPTISPSLWNQYSQRGFCPTTHHHNN